MITKETCEELTRALSLTPRGFQWNTQSLHRREWLLCVPFTSVLHAMSAYSPCWALLHLCRSLPWDVSSSLSAERPPLGLQSHIVPNSSKKKNLLPNLPSIQISPTHHFKHNNITISILRKRSRQYIMLWSFPCELSVISGAAGDGLEKSGVLLKFPLCKL